MIVIVSEGSSGAQPHIPPFISDYFPMALGHPKSNKELHGLARALQAVAYRSNLNSSVIV
jgi:hypothetical protein